MMCFLSVRHHDQTLHSSIIQHYNNRIFKNFDDVQVCKYEQEAQLMLTNPHDSFRGQSRSPNIVPFHMLGMVVSC